MDILVETTKVGGPIVGGILVVYYIVNIILEFLNKRPSNSKESQQINEMRIQKEQAQTDALKGLKDAIEKLEKNIKEDMQEVKQDLKQNERAMNEFVLQFQSRLVAVEVKVDQREAVPMYYEKPKMHK